MLTASIIPIKPIYYGSLIDAGEADCRLLCIREAASRSLQAKV